MNRLDIERYPEATDEMYVKAMYTQMLHMHHAIFTMQREIQSLSTKLEALSAHVNGDHAGVAAHGAKRRFVDGHGGLAS